MMRTPKIAIFLTLLGCVGMAASQEQGEGTRVLVVRGNFYCFLPEYDILIRTLRAENRLSELVDKLPPPLASLAEIRTCISEDETDTVPESRVAEGVADEERVAEGMAGEGVAEDMEDEEEFILRQIHPGYCWESGIVPYSLTEATRRRTSVRRGKGRSGMYSVLRVMRDITKKSCVIFKPSTANDSKELVVMSDSTQDCSTSTIGQPQNGTKNVLNVSLKCRDQVLREMMHAIGFHGEHNRPDRDEHVEIVFDNIKIAKRSSFDKLRTFDVPGLPYDFKSVTHFGRRAFSKDGESETIVPKVEVEGRLGNTRLSSRDVKRINMAYNCPAP